MNEKDDVPRSTFSRILQRLRHRHDPDKVTEDALSDLESNGHIDPDESEMIEGVLYLDKTTVREVMVPRTEIDFVDRTADIRRIVAVALESGHSRIPVVEGNLDRVLGFLHVKDLLRYWGHESDFQIDKVVRRAYVVPESKKLDDLLAELQQRREQIALVIDEFGGTGGLVSIEDILEEIVGEIGDEYDKDLHTIFHQDDDTLVVSGRFDIEMLWEHFHTEEPDGEFNTVGGWIFQRIGRVPRAGESFSFDGFDIKIQAASERQIRRLTIRRTPTPETD